MANIAENDPSIQSTYEAIMSAYDKLPPTIRIRLQNANHAFSSIQMLDAIEGHLPQDEIRNQEALSILQGFLP